MPHFAYFRPANNYFSLNLILKMTRRLHSILLFSILFLGKLSAQNAYYDAQFLLDNRTAIQDKKKAIDNLNPKPTELKNVDSVKVQEVKMLELFLKNPFDTTLDFDTKTMRQSIHDVDRIVTNVKLSRDTGVKKQEIPANYGAVATQALRGASGISAASLPATSLLSATQIIDGTALFLKQRIKEELGIAFFNRMRRRLDENDLLGRMFPSTHRLLRGVADLDNSIPSLNSLAINAFQSDMESLPESIENTLLYSSNFQEIRHDRAFKYYILPFNVVKHMRLGSHPAWVMEDMRDRYFTDSTELDRIIQMMVALNDNLRAVEKPKLSLYPDNPTTNGYPPSNNTPQSATPIAVANDKSLTDTDLWITQKEWNSFKSKTQARELFMGLLYQKNKDGIFSFLKGRSYTDIRKAMVLLSENVDDYLAQLNNFDHTYNAIQTAPNRSNKDSLGLELGWAITQLIDRSHWLYFTLLDPRQQVNARNQYWHTYKPITESTLKAIASLQRKNWAGVMLNSYQILRGLSRIEAWKDGKVFGNEHLKTFFFYGNFMTDVLTAVSSQEVASILSRYAAPVGSYTVKRRSEFSIAVNAYPGLYGGWEQARDFELPAGVVRSSFVSGVTAPIGVAFNFGGLGKRNNQSLSAFLSIIDIGAVLSYRWANDQAQGLPEKVEWAQVMSPGVHLMYGLPELPIAFSVGYQLQPRLRKVEQNGNEFKNGDFWRISFGATTDITIFNLYANGQKRRKK
jgi:hypothetical protein